MKRLTRRRPRASIAAVVTAALLVLLVPAAPVAASTNTYTLDADFDTGVAAGVEHDTVHDQLQLSTTSLALPFIWVPNYDNTVSKFDTVTGRELGRYRTGPAGQYMDPSRTTVDQNGSCWVGNRGGGTVVQIGLAEFGYYDDRDNDGVADTCADTDNDGSITGAELLSWGQDEAVLHEVVVRPGLEGTFDPGTYAGGYANNSWNPGPRSLAIDANNDLWAGCYGTSKFYHVDGDTGSILSSVTVPGHTPYGAVIDENGVIWSASLGGHVLKLDPSTNPPTPTFVPVPHTAYGIGMDGAGHIYTGSTSISKINVGDNSFHWTVPLPTGGHLRGICVGVEGDVWGADTWTNKVVRMTPGGALVASIAVGVTPSGVAVDAAGKIWSCDIGDVNIHRIDPSTNLVDLVKPVVGSGGHYSYSDMTGYLSRTLTTKVGTWKVTRDAGHAGADWRDVSWNSLEPAGTSISVKVRSSEDNATWSAWEDCTSGGALAVADGRYLQVEVRFQITSGEDSPVLYDLSVHDNEEPAVAADADPVAVDEGSIAQNTGTFSDPDGDPVTLSASRGTVTDNGGGTWSWSMLAIEGPSDSGPVTITADDGSGGSATATFQLNVANVAPSCGPITVSSALVPINTTVTASAPYSDPGVLDTHTGLWSWDDGATSAGVLAAGTANGAHKYTTPGVYTVGLTVTDDEGASGSCDYQYVVVYDPNGGFVTGGGWIMSPAGAYVPDASLAGKANFGFVSKYKKGSSVPEGNTEFQFHAAGMNFHSSTYEWLVIAGARAQYKGTGTINGAGAYKFMLTALDGQVTGGGGVDKFRIRIWDSATDALVYDNQMGADENALPTTAIGGGSIVIHKK